MQPVLLDLFCGVGGWSVPFIKAGWRCFGFDCVDLGYPGRWIPGKLPLSLERLIRYRPSLVLASPPCEDFARLHLPFVKNKPDVSGAVALLEWSISLVGRLGCPVIVECSKFSARHVAGGRFLGPYVLWGDLPALLPQVPYFKQKVSGLRPELRAAIRPELSGWICDVFSRRQCVRR